MKNFLGKIFRSSLLLGALATQLSAKEPGAITQLSQDAGLKEYRLATANEIQFKVIFYRDDVFRILAAEDGKYSDPLNDPKKAQILVDKTRLKSGVTVVEDVQKIVFKTKKLSLILDKKSSTFELQNSQGKTLWKEVKALDLAKETTQTLSTDLEEQFYGGGQQNGYFSHKGTKIDIVADGNWNEGGHPNPAPFYLSSKGYGVLRHTFAVGAYDFSNNQSIALEHNENRFDAFYFVGDDFKRVIDLYTQFTGRPNLVPIWGLELGEADAYMTRDKKTKQLSKDPVTDEFIETTPDVIERLAKKYRENDFPCGWILPNDGYGCGYVELPRVVKELKDMGFYTGLWTEGELLKTKWEVGTAGSRLQKLDVAWTGPAYQHALECNKSAWTSIEDNSDSRGFVWTVQGWAGTQRYGICWTGDQSGSWDLIRYHIPTLIGSGMSGQAYATTDVDGIFGGSPETYTRDLQWKCFTPVLYAMNGWAGDISKSPWAYEEPYKSINRDYLKLKMRMTPYMYKYTKEAWDTGAPITRGMLWEFPEDKKTWGKDTQYQYMLGESLLIAPVYTSMKVNKGFRKEDIYLPKGKWFDYSDGRTLVGPTTLDTYPITLEKLPIFVRGGAIIPMYPEMLYNNQKPKDPLTLDIYPHGNSSFEIYEDDGLTRKYQKGEFAKQLIEVEAPENKLGDILVKVGKSKGQFDGKLETRVYEFMLHTFVKPEKVTVEGVELPQNFFLSLFGSSNEVNEVETKEEFDAAVSAWYFDAKEKRGTIFVKLPRVSTEKELTVKVAIDEAQTIAAAPAYPEPVITAEIDKTGFVVTGGKPLGDGYAASMAFDGNDENMWHTVWQDKAIKHPYTIDVDMGGLYAVNALNYLPRQNGKKGRIAKYEIYLSRYKGQFDKPIFTGTFKNIKDWQKITFPTTWAKFARFKIISEVFGANYATASEFTLLQDLKAPKLEDEILYLSDLKAEKITGTLNNDKSAGGKAIVVNGKTYKKGLGVKANSEIIYKLDGTWDKLLGHVGMDDEVGDKGSVMFRVFADGNLIFESPEQTGKSIKQLMELNIFGVKELKLILLDLGDGNELDHGDWVDAKLLRKGSE